MLQIKSSNNMSPVLPMSCLLCSGLCICACSDVAQIGLFSSVRRKKTACLRCCPRCLVFTLSGCVCAHMHTTVCPCMCMCVYYVYKSPAASPLPSYCFLEILLIRPVPEARAPYTADVPLKRP